MKQFLLSSHDNGNPFSSFPNNFQIEKKTGCNEKTIYKLKLIEIKILKIVHFYQ